MTDISKHTPGPWDVMHHDTWRGHTYDQPSSVCHVGDYTIVTSSPSYEFHGADDADARLIAAAPDMLAAMQMAVEAIERGSSTAPVAECLRAALAKATGASIEAEPIEMEDLDSLMTNATPITPNQ